MREGRRSAPAAARIGGVIREFFADSHVPEDDYKYLLHHMEGPDPDDCHHMAAAIAGHARTLVTWNLADFPATFLSRYGVTVTDPDTYLCSLLSQSPREVMDVLARVAAGKRRPPMTVLTVVDALDRAGVSRFAGRIRGRLPAVLDEC
ncbi:PIN domain-containing protein [Streptosporangium sp. NPDC051023]|uniref:PIN domain-containing protein n=1 Tax=Streptosporangium sp. NPDC051023 TaxID=3155410 RepID=UPI00344C2EC5